jgi:ribosomal protein L37AE/L43A
MRHTNEYESIDKAALYDALLALRTCPHCRADLLVYPLANDVWGCKECKETWYLQDFKREAK